MVCCENQGVMTESHAVLGISTSHNHLLVVFLFFYSLCEYYSDINNRATTLKRTIRIFSLFESMFYNIDVI